MGKMNIKPPTPTQFDGKNPRFNEWAGEVKAYLTIHNDYTAEDYIKWNNKFPTAPAEDTNEYEECNEMTMNIRKRKDDIASFSQTLNYLLVHSTRPGSEAGSIVRRIMRQSSRFEACRQLTLHSAAGHRAQQFPLLRTLMQPNWDSTTKQLTRTYYKWLEDINRYASENGQGSIADHVSIATITNHLKRPIAQHLMQRVNNTTTCTEVRQLINNFFNNTYTGTDDDNAAIGEVTEQTETDKYNEQMMIAFNKRYKGRKRTMGDDNYHNYKGGKDKGKQPMVCYTCGRPSHTAPQCYHTTKGKGKGRSHQYNNKGHQAYSPQQQYGGGKSKGKNNNYNV
eukprot:3447446-Amphidinium_carterae.1